MADPRFFPKTGTLTLEQVLELTGATLAYEGPEGRQRVLSDVAPLDRATAADISFLDNVKYIDVFAGSQAGACFIRSKYKERAPRGMALLFTEEPYRCFALVAQKLYPSYQPSGNLSPKASIAASAKLGRGCSVDAGAFIGERADIGAGCHIGVNAVIHDGVVIGEHTHIGSNSTLSHCIVGSRVIIHRGVHIGQDGFGFALGRDRHVKVPQLGRVVIEDDVEIGSGTCIDRGAGPDTFIGQGVKIDNLVQIGHNVHIGKQSIVVAQVGIAGSTRIGDGVMLGGQAGIAGHLKIGHGARLAAQSGVMTDIPPGTSYGGSPAIEAKDWHRQTIALERLAKRKGDGNE
jgi:UDP-3-O-[3-hydroxymyristoyl] glucosamine N-acyltransferase